MQKNLTLKLDEHLIIKAKQKAIGKGESLSTIIGDFLRKFCAPESDFEQSKKRAIARMHKGFDLGGTFNREELYDRP